MKLNAWFPTCDIGDDPAKIRDWAQAAEDLGFEYIEVPDHVFGATARDGWTPRYDAHAPFHETFTTMAYLAACTTRIKLSSGVLILPQRQTGVVAKQAAEVDILSGGRVRLGIGVGWNHVEYEALGCDWKTRGVKQGEQIEVLRKLWIEDLVTFKGRFHDYVEVTVVPQPRQRPIPIWLGGSAAGVIKRAARLGDGWMPILAPDDDGKKALETLHGHLDAFGRKRADFGLEAWLRFHDNAPQAWAAAADGWRALGADMAMLYPMWRDGSVDNQIEILRRFKEVAGG
ncbi:MAG: LLM class F420-dependent oxidoreductase [Alphaproteobacteria bacterium]|nr:LLM class F420-dependent oxidoreductase [Alphaproteobacteria bacterium]MCB9931053.1 LLM class F420-dependent oxidoreductase [Alphaproteobacteria bacterium]